MKNNSGKTLTIFLLVMLIISVCLASIALYYYQNESTLRKSAEANLARLKTVEAKLQGELMESKKQLSVLGEKNKEMDDNINDLSESLDLEKSLKEAQKKENQDLREALESENQSKEKLRTELSKELNSAQEKVATLESQLTAVQIHVKELETQSQDLQNKLKQAGGDLDPQGSPILTPNSGDMPPGETPGVKAEGNQRNKEVQPDLKQVQLEPIVVAGAEVPQGRVLSVDKENEFLIFNLGEKDGVRPGFLMSIYRGEDYLGDVKVSRVQSEMSAADFVPPFSSQKVRKNDQVVAKK